MTKPKCPHPEKRQYSTRAEAKNVIRAMYRTGNGNRDLHAYLCPCGSWHVGHSVVRFGKRIRHSLRRGAAGGRSTANRRRR